MSGDKLLKIIASLSVSLTKSLKHEESREIEQLFQSCKFGRVEEPAFSVHRTVRTKMQFDGWQERADNRGHQDHSHHRN